ncbi:MAG: NAD(P)/FAD-dependent oxidoreductase [Clostridia bacterium]|nr:NAD(P)/FAD-dependent oxidoreductase [Clostridia bacterium]
MIYDVIIIGAGITGAMTARALSRYELKLAIVEAGSDVASGATRANSAIVHAGFDAANGTLKAKLNARGCAMMPEVCAALDVPYKNNTSLVIAFGDDEENKLEELRARGEANGVEGLRIIGKDELHALEPSLSDNATAALLAPSAGIVCPYELATAACENAVVNGADFITGFKVDNIIKEENLISVCSGDKTLTARFVVSAAGCAADEIAAAAHEESFPVKIIPRRGEYMLMDKKLGSLAKATLFMLPSAAGKGVLVSPTVDNNLIIGPNAHEVEKGDTSTTSAGLDEILAGAKRLIPSIDTRSVITSFAGVRATPSTDDFYIEESASVPGLLHAAGIESPGLASSPAVAEYVKDKLVSMGLDLTERKDYIPTRRAYGHMKKHFRDMTDDEKNEAIKNDPAYGRIICRCETVTEGDIVEAIHSPLGSSSLDMIKRRTRAGMGRCQGGFCSVRVVDIIARELGVDMSEVVKDSPASRLLYGKTK